MGHRAGSPAWMLAAAGLAVGAAAGAVVLWRGMRWGSTAKERARTMAGDEWLAGGARCRVAMTRAVSIPAPPQRVWPWLAQLGRGAGWYSIDQLDNRGRVSAWHVVSWTPAPRLGDATAIGTLRHLAPGESLAWWCGETRFLGSEARMVASYALRREDEGTRLVARMSADAAGPTAPLAMLVFQLTDSIMARRQLLGLRARVMAEDEGRAPLEDAETGARDQYQRYEVMYASGERAGATGEGEAGRFRLAAAADGLLHDPAWL